MYHIHFWTTIIEQRISQQVPPELLSDTWVKYISDILKALGFYVILKYTKGIL